MKAMLCHKCNELCMMLQLQVKHLFLSFFKPTFQRLLAVLVMCTPGMAATGTGEQQQDNSELYCEGWATAPAQTECIMSGIRLHHFIFHSTQDISPFNSQPSLFSAFMTLNIYIFNSVQSTLFTVHPEQSYSSLFIYHNNTGRMLIYTSLL